MKKIIIQEESNDGMNISIEKEVGMDCFELSFSSHISLIAMSRAELLMLQSMIAEILEN